MKRTERKHLKEDEFASGLQKFFDFFTHNKNIFFIGLGLVAVGILIFVGVRFIQGQGLERQGQVESQILELYAGLDKEPGNAAQLEEMASPNGAGRLAYLLLGNYWVSRGNLEKAEALLGKVKDSSKDLVYYQAQDLLGQIYFQRKDYDKAIDIYKAIQVDEPKEYPLDEVIFRQAEALEKKGQKDEALTLYKKVQDEYMEGAFAYQAAQKVRQLESKS
jgi:tetratricopeptide (TPR) repeat protein